MQPGRFHLARGSGSLLLSGILTFCLVPQTFAQSGAANLPSGAAAPHLPEAQPVADIAVPASGAQRPTAEATVLNPAARDSSAGLKLGPGDLIEISVYNVPELSTKVRVGNSGNVYLPLIDYVHVGDLTVSEAQDAIEKRLEDGGFVHNAHVAISVDESPSQRVTILGEVVKPGIYPAVGNQKLYDYISAAGGFTAAAGRKISIIREHDQTPLTVDLPRNLADSLKDNIDVLPGDTITIPRAPIIYVVGDVGHPTGLLIDNGSLTVLQAIALAGGTNHTAKMNDARIIRKGTEGMTETKLPLKKMLEAKAPDVTLQADDILFIPLSGVRVAASQTLQAALTATTGIAIIAAHP